MGVEWSERTEPADARPERHTQSKPDRATDGERPLVLTNPERRVAEYHRYRDVVVNDEAAHAWDQAAPELRGAWEKVKAKYGYAERSASVAQPADGSWRGEGDRKLDAAQNVEIDRGYARIREVAEHTIIPVLRAVEAEDPSRRLVGFDHRFKGLDRLKEKVADRMRTKGRPPAETLAQIPDVVRFTFRYSESAYSAGVMKDIKRLETKGFTQVQRRNTWESDQYKGINTQWREPGSGATFEVQFHTRASHEAKELTHGAYERIRSITSQTPEADQETSELKEFQRLANSKIPVPPGVADVRDYPPGGH